MAQISIDIDIDVGIDSDDETVSPSSRHYTNINIDVKTNVGAEMTNQPTKRQILVYQPYLVLPRRQYHQQKQKQRVTILLHEYFSLSAI